MAIRNSGNGWATLAVTLVLAATGCGGEICGDDCAVGVSCSEQLEVPSDYSLDEAAAQAGAGSCILLAPGSYAGVTLKGGVSLLGPGAEQATVGTVELLAGDGAVVRRLRVDGMVKVRPDATEVWLDSLQVGGANNGVQAEAGASFTLVDSQVVGAKNNGVLAVDAARVTVERSSIEEIGGPGLWAQCTAGCDCASKPLVELRDVGLRANAYMGVSLYGVAATFDTVEISDTGTQGDFDQGGGLVASACSEIQSAASLTISGSASYGALVNHSAASFGGLGSEKGIIIVNNHGGGLWVQDIAPEQGLVMADATFSDNGVVGLGIGGGSRGIIIVNNRVANTASTQHPSDKWVETFPGSEQYELQPLGMDSIGDAMIWGEGASVQVDGLTLSGSGRNALLIDGAVAAGSELGDVTLEGGDEGKGIVQQRVGAVGEAPAISGTTPSVQQLGSAASTIPEAPKPPAAL